MTVQTTPWNIQGATHSSEVARNAVAAMFGVPVAAHTAAASVTTVGGGHGVIGNGDLAVTQNGTPNMSVNVAAGRAIVRSGGSSSLLAGSYATMNDATLNLAIAAADATNPRRDLVVMQVRDLNYGEAASDARLTVVTGTPAASPADPALTSYPNCVVLARVAVAAAATTITNANITDLRTWAYAQGGMGAGATAARPSGASLRTGQAFYDSTLGAVIVYNGTAWQLVSPISGTYTPTLVGPVVGTGGSAANTAVYNFDGKTLSIWGKIIFGTSGATYPQTTTTIALPTGYTTSISTGQAQPMGQAQLGAAGAYHGYLRVDSTTTLRLFVLGTAGAYQDIAAPSPTIPGAWAAGSTIYWSVTLPASVTI